MHWRRHLNAGSNPMCPGTLLDILRSDGDVFEKGVLGLSYGDGLADWSLGESRGGVIMAVMIKRHRCLY